MSPATRIAFLPLVLMLISCVTINIYFPEAAAEDAARAIVRDALGEEAPEGNPEGGTTPEPSSQWQNEGTVVASLAVRLLDVLAPAAYAQEQADIDIDTPTIRALRASLKDLEAKLSPYKKSGAIGYDARTGLLDMRDLSLIPLKKRNDVKKLMAEDNDVRNALYEAIASANKHPEWEQNIRETFARVWIDEMPAGAWYKDRKGAWKQK
jgi:uncharacterized protein YdbL (DUF1318 family)